MPETDPLQHEAWALFKSNIWSFSVSLIFLRWKGQWNAFCILQPVTLALGSFGRSLEGLLSKCEKTEHSRSFIHSQSVKGLQEVWFPALCFSNQNNTKQIFTDGDCHYKISYILQFSVFTPFADASCSSHSDKWLSRRKMLSLKTIFCWDLLRWWQMSNDITNKGIKFVWGWHYSVVFKKKNSLLICDYFEKHGFPTHLMGSSVE